MVLLLLLTGCIPAETFWGVQAMDVPEVYAEWYRDTEDCLGTMGDFGSVRWYTAEKMAYDGVSLSGYWDAPNGIVIKSDFVWVKSTVRHEAAHHITQDTDIHVNGDASRAICDGEDDYES